MLRATLTSLPWLARAAQSSKLQALTWMATVKLLLLVRSLPVNPQFFRWTNPAIFWEQRKTVILRASSQTRLRPWFVAPFLFSFNCQWIHAVV